MRPRNPLSDIFFGLVIVCLLTCSAAPLPAQSHPQHQEPAPVGSQLQARNAIDQGVQAFKAGQNQDAIRFFRTAKDLDPSLLNARLYLATVYAALYIPGAPSEENISKGQMALDEYKGVLAMDAENLPAIDGIGSILFQMAGSPYDKQKFEESKQYHRQHIQIRPEDPEPYYWVGVIDWALAFRANGELREAYNQQHPDHPIPDANPLPSDVRAEYQEQYGAAIDEGIDHMRKAIALRPDYDDAMAYLNLLYRRKADLVPTESEREHFLKMADDLIEQVKTTKEKKLLAPTKD